MTACPSTHPPYLRLLSSLHYCSNAIDIYNTTMYQPLGDAQARRRKARTGPRAESPSWQVSVFGELASSSIEFSWSCLRRPATSTNPSRATYLQKLLSMALVKQDDELVIKPEAVAPNVNYADWPLLLKNWDQRMSLHQPVIGSAVRLQTLRASTP